LQTEIAALRSSATTRHPVPAAPAAETRVSLGGAQSVTLRDEPQLAALLEWASLVAGRHGVVVRDFTGSFTDGAALCTIVHHYCRELLPKHLVQMPPVAGATAADDSSDEVRDKKSPHPHITSPRATEPHTYMHGSWREAGVDGLRAHPKKRISAERFVWFLALHWNAHDPTAR
jgi:hypothetical protein